MKSFLIVLFAFCLSVGPLALANESHYVDCILKHLGGAKIDLTVDLMKQACNENYRPSSLSRRSTHTLNECLLKHLAGVENAKAAVEIKNACARLADVFD